MNVIHSTEPANSKAIFERALEQLDPNSESSVDPRHRAIAPNRRLDVSGTKSKERALQDAADALTSLWRNQKR
jgi:hypothetical protein